MDKVLNNMLLSLIFSLLGFVLLFVGYRVFDALTPADIGKRIFDDGNVAAAILMASFIIGLAIVVAAAIS
jgi:uncharacterized membrane protein YjfL (UPF0719 family)